MATPSHTLAHLVLPTTLWDSRFIPFYTGGHSEAHSFLNRNGGKNKIMFSCQVYLIAKPIFSITVLSCST